MTVRFPPAEAKRLAQLAMAEVDGATLASIVKALGDVVYPKAHGFPRGAAICAVCAMLGELLTMGETGNSADQEFAVAAEIILFYRDLFAEEPSPQAIALSAATPTAGSA
ncbi:hypothetical protein EOD42_22255 [Rhodovarius crocodyli]|uniref:Uncharacterized protein n=1 Tax=Rhodovarius crocodyli TaxID=1979269 RepID=A0A437M0Z2_9PROT|nr:hypothetical protein [Rhodovarius crocodyli]RVT91380.1 hypothetical protein EOD42_22255 [Rhodovarius crocodyli]